jgi:hypothetical protein
MQRILTISLSVFLVLGVAVGSYFWSQKNSDTEVYTQNSSSAKQEAIRLLASEDRKDQQKAIAMINLYQSQTHDVKSKNEWTNLLIEACVKLKGYRRLGEVHELYPEKFIENEEASIMIGDYFLANNLVEKYIALRSSWKKKARRKDQWFFLEASRLIVEGKMDEAVRWLESKKFEGNNESERLIKLALLKVKNDPNGAWKYLHEAHVKNPKNPSLRSIRGKALETFGKTELARSEYNAAIYYDQKNPWMKDQLAEFYQRQKNYGLALNTWNKVLEKDTDSSIWAKAWFWNKVTHPLPRDWSGAITPEDEYSVLTQFYFNMPKDKFWNDELVNNDPVLRKFLHKDQTTYWLRILGYIQEGKEEEAYKLLSYNMFKDKSWNPELELSLKRILNYKKHGTLGFSKSSIRTENQHPYFFLLNKFCTYDNSTTLSEALPADLKALLNSPEAFPAALAAGGWLEAAVVINNSAPISDKLPEWYAYSISQAFRTNRGNQKAIEYLSNQPKHPSLNLLKGESLIGMKMYSEALSNLQPLADANTNVGVRAAWLIGLVHLQNQQPAEAKRSVYAHSHFAKTLLGKELLAKIALFEGKQEEAKAHYLEIEEVSAEAQSYLAQDAFAKNQFERAKRLTEKLLRRYPNNTTLRKNLTTIVEKEKTQVK